jgi:cytochrome c-type biogenesis protein CcmH
LTAVVLVALQAAANAAIDIMQFEYPAQEARYHELIKELRCLVCQNQNLADSDADLARDLRDKAYEMIIAGRSDQEIVDYMVDRYGDFVLYRPPIKTSTIVLWVGPFVILLACLGVLIRIALRRAGAGEPELSAEQRDRAKRLLRED